MKAKRRALHRKAVHRRRRTVAVALVLFVIVAVVALVVTRPWEALAPERDGSASPAPSELLTPSASPSPSPTATQPYTPVGGESEAASDGGTCAADQIILTPQTDATTYASGVPVQMSFQIQNTSDTPCSLNVGTTQQTYEIRTGNQVVFRSADCPIDLKDQVVELQPDTPQQTIPITWDRTFSSPETCTAPRSQVVAGGASYHLSVTVAGLASTETRQFMLY